MFIHLVLRRENLGEGLGSPGRLPGSGQDFEVQCRCWIVVDISFLRPLSHTHRLISNFYLTFPSPTQLCSFSNKVLP